MTLQKCLTHSTSKTLQKCLANSTFKFRIITHDVGSKSAIDINGQGIRRKPWNSIDILSPTNDFRTIFKIIPYKFKSLDT